MQVDGPDHHANPSMLPSPTGTPSLHRHQVRPDLAALASRMKVSSFICETLGRLGHPDDDDAKIQSSLRFVWLTVEEALSEDPEVIERPADRDEFEANVEHEGERKVIDLLGDMAKKGSRLNIIKSSTCINSSDIKRRSDHLCVFKHTRKDTEPISTASRDGG
jgi:hypothetical protein